MMEGINLNTERLLLVALMKAWSEQSTYMTGSLKMELKQSLNNLVKRNDEFVVSLEKNMNEASKEYILKVVDLYHNINLEARKNLNKLYKKLEEEESCLESKN